MIQLFQADLGRLRGRNAPARWQPESDLDGLDDLA